LLTMPPHETRIRVRYAETDQMGVVYYANYLVWMEVGRVEYCKACGFEYKQMELEDGVFLAAADARCPYASPARFDEEVVIRTWVEEAQNTDESILTGVRQGIGFVRKQGAMVGLIALAFCMTALAIPTLTFLPVFAKDVFHRGPTAFTILLSCSGVGSVAGALIVAALGNVKNKGQIALLTLLLLGGAIAGFAISKSIVLSGALLVVSGAAISGALSMGRSLVL